MITEDDAERAVEYLRDNARPAAQARAERIYMEEYRKSLKAKIMREEPGTSVANQEARAYADPRYQEHLESMRTAIERDEYCRWMMVAAEAKISAWQTQSRNNRAADRV